MKRLNVILEEDLHRALKMTAIEQGITMSQYVTDLLQEKLQNQKPEEAEE